MAGTAILQPLVPCRHGVCAPGRISHPEELCQSRNTCGNTFFSLKSREEGRQNLGQDKWMMISISVLSGRESQRSPTLFLPIFFLVFPPTSFQSPELNQLRIFIHDLLGLLPCYFCVVLWDYKVLSPMCYHSISVKADDVNITIIILQVK